MMPAEDVKKQDRPVVVVFRTDLRIADNRALAAAAGTGRPVVPLYVLDETLPAARRPGGASMWWLHHSLVALAESLEKLGARLILRRGDPLREVEDVADAVGAGGIYWNRSYEPHAAHAGTRIKQRWREAGLEAESFDGALLHEPSRVSTGGGGFYKVYSPFWRALAAQPEPRDPVDPPERLTPVRTRLKSAAIADWKLLPHGPDWAGGLRECWTPGEKGAASTLDDFLEDGLHGYAENRDRPDRAGTSRLSAHLAFGEITPYQIFHALRERARKLPGGDVDRFRKEIGWREFSYHLLFHNPDLSSRNFDEVFDEFPWRRDVETLHRWQKGQTGYPIVDAGMRQLWQTGWMHNRVRMIAASFLIKHLLIDWRKGEAWFWDTLVDADPANNAASWQWVAGSGADAAPYFRIFNPILQGERFDPHGTYVRRFVPEIAGLPDRFIHKPWEASEAELNKAGVKLGKTYPAPVVDHADARARALAAFEAIKRHR